MKIQDIINVLETVAPPSLQESYDNAGLIIGDPQSACTGVLTTLDATEEVIIEAKSRGCNLVLAHHPIVFSGLKKISGHDYVGRTVIRAIREDIAIYAIHTNLDNVLNGVNGRIAEALGLQDTRVLQPKKDVLRKIFTFVPHAHLEKVRNALFAAGAGHIGKYDEASYSVQGTGTFRAGPGAQPFVGETGVRHHEPESKLEMIFPAHLERAVIAALTGAHPYEEVAYDIVPLTNADISVGSGLVGDLPTILGEREFLLLVKEKFGLELIRHSPLTGNGVKKVAVCGGAGSFLISRALSVGANVFLSSDLKYHEFFDANGRLVIADIGHYESEQFTINLLFDLMQEKFPNFAVLKSGTRTNPVNYLI